MNEIAILKACHSKHIGAVLDVFEDEAHLYIVQEFIDGFNLADFLKGGVPRIEKVTKKIVSGLIEGLQYLHSLGIAHRDIKLENIMLSITTNEVISKFIDFGLSKVLLTGETSDERFGTIAYCSPEILAG